MASYQGQVDTFARSCRWAKPDGRCGANRTISLIHVDQARELNIEPSELCDDAGLARVYLDVIGTLPTADERAVLVG